MTVLCNMCKASDQTDWHMQDSLLHVFMAAQGRSPGLVRVCNTATLWMLQVEAAVDPECSSFRLSFASQNLALFNMTKLIQQP